VFSLWKEIRNLSFYCWILAAETIKIGYVATCECGSIGQPFNAWFFPSFHAWPYSSWWTYKGIRFLAGPYSLLWWALNSPAFFGYVPFFAYLLAFDLVAFFLIQRKSRLYGVYFLTLTVWFTTYDPVDFFPVLFAVAGRYRLVWLVLAPLTKLPIGAPVSVWRWVFTSHDSFGGSENYGRYLILGSVWLFSLALYLYQKSRKKCFKPAEPAAQVTCGLS
jgi:hypothetical protein